jgi:hypothetical protein
VYFKQKFASISAPSIYINLQYNFVMHLQGEVKILFALKIHREKGRKVAHENQDEQYFSSVIFKIFLIFHFLIKRERMCE